MGCSFIAEVCRLRSSGSRHVAGRMRYVLGFEVVGAAVFEVLLPAEDADAVSDAEDFSHKFM